MDRWRVSIQVCDLSSKARHRNGVDFASEITRDEPTSNRVRRCHAPRYVLSGWRARGASCPATPCSTSSRGRSLSRGSPKTRLATGEALARAAEAGWHLKQRRSRREFLGDVTRGAAGGALWPPSLDRSSSSTPREPTRAAALRSL